MTPPTQQDGGGDGEEEEEEESPFGSHQIYAVRLDNPADSSKLLIFQSDFKPEGVHLRLHELCFAQAPNTVRIIIDIRRDYDDNFVQLLTRDPHPEHGDWYFCDTIFSESFVAAYGFKTSPSHLSVWERRTAQFLPAFATINTLSLCRLEGPWLTFELGQPDRSGVFSVDLMSEPNNKDPPMCELFGSELDVIRHTSDTLYYLPARPEEDDDDLEPESAVLSRFTVYDIRAGEILSDVQLDAPVKFSDVKHASLRGTLSLLVRAAPPRSRLPLSTWRRGRCAVCTEISQRIGMMRTTGRN